jgi:DNA mismatch repair protein MutS
VTPLMQQWTEVKNQHLDKVVAFRMGDFFEFFNEDAEAVAPALGIQLTQRNKKSNDYTPMCGLPHHSLPDIASRLLAKGFRLAICDQVEDPKFAKGLVKREVTRVLTPGMVYDPLTLKPSDSNFMMSFDDREVAFLEASTGEGFYYSIAEKTTLEGLLKILNPVEILLREPNSEQDKSSILVKLKDYSDRVVWVKPLANSDLVNAVLPSPREVLVDYAKKSQGSFVLSTPFEERFWNQRMILSELTLKHLEITDSFHKDGVSLFDCLNVAKTAAGSRLLKSWMLFPLNSVEMIKDRQDEVENFVNDFDLIKKVRASLANLNDLQRLMGKLSLNQSQPRDLVQLIDALEIGFATESLFASSKNDLQLKRVNALTDDISAIIERDQSKWTDQYGYICRGKNSELDELIELTEDSKVKLLNLESRLKTETQIANLKVGYNSVFGYFIEVSK